MSTLGFWIGAGSGQGGVLLSGCPHRLYSANITPGIAKAEAEVKGSILLRLSYIGRANILKMVTFPRLLYPLQALPLLLTCKGEYIKHFVHLSGGGKKACIGLIKLQQKKAGYPFLLWNSPGINSIYPFC